MRTVVTLYWYTGLWFSVLTVLMAGFNKIILAL